MRVPVGEVAERLRALSAQAQRCRGAAAAQPDTLTVAVDDNIDVARNIVFAVLEAARIAVCPYLCRVAVCEAFPDAVAQVALRE
jgi:hypothetical protein